MKLCSFLVVSCVLCFTSLQAISTTCAQDQTAAGGPDKIKAMLLRPAGWRADWSGHGGSGVSELIFEARGEKVVAKIQRLTPSFWSCERDVTITSDVVKLDLCYDPDLTLLFDPNDHDYPFKGKTPKGYEYNLKAK